MKYKQAQEQLRVALQSQQSISISKLKTILQALNISVNKPQEYANEKYLKNEIKKRDKRIRKLEKRIRRMLNEHRT